MPAGGSYGWHFDAYDSLLICVAGSKRLLVAGVGVGPGEHARPKLDVCMRPADAVFIPAGCYHCGSDATHLDVSAAGRARPGGGECEALYEPSTSVLLSIGLTSRHRSPTLLIDRIQRDAKHWRGSSFHTGERLSSIQSNL